MRELTANVILPLVHSKAALMDLSITKLRLVVKARDKMLF